MAAAAAALTYTPTPQELPLYEALFQTADGNQRGSISGAEAVAFFSRSKLPVQALRQIWTLADSSKTNTLHRAEFFVAVRLIQLYQNGEKGEGADLQARAGVVLKPPVFENFTMPQPTPTPVPVVQHPPVQQPVVVQQPTPVVQQGNGGGALTTDPYALTPGDISSYSALFPNYADTNTNKVPGQVAVTLFTKSGLDTGVLRGIWAMCDVDGDNMLDLYEFVAAMHLIVCVGKKGCAVPGNGALPPGLKGYVTSKGGTLGNAVGSVAAAPSTPSGDPMSLPSPNSVMPPPNVNVNAPMAQVAAPVYQQQPPPLQQQQVQQQVPEDRFSAFDDLDTSTVVSTGHYSVNNHAMQQPQQQQQQQQYPTNTTSTNIMGGGGGMSVGNVSIGMSAANSITEPPSPVPVPVQHQHTTAAAAAVPMMQMPSIVDEAVEVPASEPVPPVATVSYTTPTPAPTLAPAPASSNNESSNGAQSLQSLVTKLQAENISLKAKLGTYSSEEGELVEQKQKLLVDIGALMDRLTVLREEVVTKREAIGVLGAEVAVLGEKKEVLKEAVVAEEGHLEWMEGVQQAQQQQQQVQEPAAAAPVVQDMDFFGATPVVSAPVPAPAPVMSSYHQEQPFNVAAPAPAPLESSSSNNLNPFEQPQQPQPVAVVQPAPVPVQEQEPPEPTAEETARLAALRENTDAIRSRREEASTKIVELTAASSAAAANANSAEQEVADINSAKTKFGGKKKKAKALEAATSKASLERQKAYEAAHAVKLAEEGLRTLQAELETAEVELVSYESYVQDNLQKKKAEMENGNNYNMAPAPAPVPVSKPAPAPVYSQPPAHLRTNTAEITSDMFGLYGGAVMGGGDPSPDKQQPYGNGGMSGAANTNPFW
eukprot:CAMPEP_0116041446 /NCGR_PEP_ID=MMETSP0321-20121206/25061_1 /TAXON_ID=163516 /ORGANISM="Leptocylindrus danicus var. danicus, Strain B650" /LENGTH=877 /DNA_ID=CAMNT_0003521657 /DNA_START=162 /DNA_END=2792 /DNA_ORIENTATION=-